MVAKLLVPKYPCAPNVYVFYHFVPHESTHQYRKVSSSTKRTPLYQKNSIFPKILFLFHLTVPSYTKKGLIHSITCAGVPKKEYQQKIPKSKREQKQTFVKKYMTYDIWHVTCDTWHVTYDTWQVGVVNHLSKCELPSSYGLGVKVFWRYFHIGWLS